MLGGGGARAGAARRRAGLLGGGSLQTREKRTEAKSPAVGDARCNMTEFARIVLTCIAAAARQSRHLCVLRDHWVETDNIWALL